MYTVTRIRSQLIILKLEWTICIPRTLELYFIEIKTVILVTVLSIVPF